MKVAVAHALVVETTTTDEHSTPLAANVGTGSPALRPRSVMDRARDLLTSGPVSRRKQF